MMRKVHAFFCAMLLLGIAVQLRANEAAFVGQSAVDAAKAPLPQGLSREGRLVYQRVNDKLRYLHDEDKHLCFIEYAAADVELINCTDMGRSEPWYSYFAAMMNSAQQRMFERSRKMLQQYR